MMSDHGVKRISDAINLSNISVPCADLERMMNNPDIPTAYSNPMNASCEDVRLDAREMSSPASNANPSDTGYTYLPSRKRIESAAPRADICPMARSVKIIPDRKSTRLNSSHI